MTVPAAADSTTHVASLAAAMGDLLAVMSLGTCLGFWMSQYAAPPTVDPLLALLAVTSANFAMSIVAARRGAPPMLLLVVAAAVTCAGTCLVEFGPHGAAPALSPSYLLSGPVAFGWTVFATRLRIVGATLIIVGCDGMLAHGSLLSFEATMTTLASAALAHVGSRVLRVAATKADAEQDAADAELTEARAASASQSARTQAGRILHDLVLSALDAASRYGTLFDWEQVRRKCKTAEDALSHGQSWPDPDEHVDLVVAVERQASEASTLNINMMANPRQILMPEPVARGFSQAVGEALRNVAEHAGTPNVTVIIHERAGSVTVAVQDLGRGLELASAPGRGRGISGSILERAAEVGATADIDSTIGVGTTVTLRWERPAAAPADRAPIEWAKTLFARDPSAILLAYLGPPALSYVLLFAIHFRDQRSHLLSIAAAGTIVYCVWSCRGLVTDLSLPTRKIVWLAIGNAAAAGVAVIAISPRSRTRSRSGLRAQARSCAPCSRSPTSAPGRSRLPAQSLPSEPG